MASLTGAGGSPGRSAGAIWRLLRDWPWFETLRTLRERFREDRLGLTASSLTFTTLMSLVPLATVALAVFAAFPIFASFQAALETYFLRNLVPEAISRPVLRGLSQFAAKASQAGALGVVVFGVTAIALMLTIDRTLNNIWRVRRPRPIAQRVLVYWAALTLGPLALGISLTATTYAISAGRSLAETPPGGVNWLFGALQFGLLAAGVAALFHYVPNTFVRWRHAWAGAIFVAVAFEGAKELLAWYLQSVPIVTTVYGAFATVPILLLWIYLGWLIVLFGAVIAAYAPSLTMRIARRSAAPGHRFELALALLRELDRARAGGVHGASLEALAAALRTDPLQVEPVLDRLVELDLVARLDEAGEQRLVLLGEPWRTPAAPLVDALLLAPAEGTRLFRERAGFARLTLSDLLGTAG